jgi:hypothetical protein
MISYRLSNRRQGNITDPDALRRFWTRVYYCHCIMKLPKLVWVRHPHGRLWERDGILWKVHGFYVGRNGWFLGFRRAVGKARLVGSKDNV